MLHKMMMIAMVVVLGLVVLGAVAPAALAIDTVPLPERPVFLLRIPMFHTFILIPLRM